MIKPIVKGLEVFVITNDVVHDDVLDGLERQTIVPENIVILNNFSPMDFAFKTMLTSSSGKFHVQLDSDMVLFPNALETLLTGIVYDENCYMCGAKLFDMFRGEIGYVKIFRTELCQKDTTIHADEKNLPPGEVSMDLKMKPLGFSRNLLDVVVGNHVPYLSGFGTYSSFANVGRKCGYHFSDYYVKNMLNLISSLSNMLSLTGDPKFAAYMLSLGMGFYEGTNSEFGNYDIDKVKSSDSFQKFIELARKWGVDV